MKKRSFTLTPPDSRLIKVNGRRPSLKTPSARWAVASGRPGSHGFWLRQTGNVWYGKPETDSSDVWSTTVVGGFDFSVFSGACCEWCIIYIYSTQYAHAHTHTHIHIFYWTYTVHERKKTLGFLCFFLLFQMSLLKVVAAALQWPRAGTDDQQSRLQGQVVCPKDPGTALIGPRGMAQKLIGPAFCGWVNNYSNSKKEKQSKILVNSWQSALCC